MISKPNPIDPSEMPSKRSPEFARGFLWGATTFLSAIQRDASMDDLKQFVDVIRRVVEGENNDN